MFGQYAYSQDNHKMDRYPELFADDLRFEVDQPGKQPIVADKQQLVVGAPARHKQWEAEGNQRRHFITGIYFAEQTTDSAHVFANWLLGGTPKEGAFRIDSTGHYDSRFIKHNGKWLIQHWAIHFDQALPMPDADRDKDKN
jgi:hypothetical protein